MTENEARALLRDCDGQGGLEGWVARQPWHVVAGGWMVPGELHGWRFRLEPAPGGIHVTASSGEGAPAVWTVAAR
jgi:hypothetical protein